MPAGEVPVLELAKESEVIIQQGSYFGAACRVAGVVKGLEVERDATHLILQATGTDSEGLLRHCTGQPSGSLRVHLCGADCGADRVSEDLIHAVTLRQAKAREDEDPWTRNSLSVEGGPGDDLKDLRAKKKELEVEERKSPGRKKRDKKRSRSRRSRRRSKRSRGRSVGRKKEKKEAAGREVAPAERSSSSSSSKDVRLDGRRPRGASVKTLQALFAGTGLDGKEKVRRRVARRARKLVRRKKAERSGSSSRSSSSGNDEDLDIGQDEGFFESETKVQKVAEACPGALAARSLVSMRKVLLESAGLDAEEQLVSPTAVKYFRQELQKKTSGPVSRELVTLCSAVDHLLRGRAAQAMDCMLQRVKSVETTIAGSHWSVSQRLELPPLDMQTIAPREEIISAQKAAAVDARSRFLASQPDGRGKAKGSGKSKEQPHPEWRNDRDRGKGKSSGKKDKGKKKEEG